MVISLALVCVSVLGVGAHGQPLYTWMSPIPEISGAFGLSHSGAGDVKGDGFDDLVVGTHHEHAGAPYSGRASVFSGQTGDLIHTLLSPNAQALGFFGYSVSDARDADGGGYGDVTVGV